MSCGLRSISRFVTGVQDFYHQGHVERRLWRTTAVFIFPGHSSPLLVGRLCFTCPRLRWGMDKCFPGYLEETANDSLKQSKRRAKPDSRIVLGSPRWLATLRVLECRSRSIARTLKGVSCRSFRCVPGYYLRRSEDGRVENSTCMMLGGP